MSSLRVPMFRSGFLVAALSTAALLAGCPDLGRAEKVTLDGSGGYTYCADVKPIFDQKCSRCHSPDGAEFPDLDVYAEREPGFGSVSTHLDASLLRMKLGEMPPAGEPERQVTATELALIKAWKAEGAPEGSCN